MRTITCFGNRTAALSRIIASVSRKRRWLGLTDQYLCECKCFLFNSVTSPHVLSYRKSKLCKKRRINIWNYSSPYLQCRPSWVTAHAQFPITKASNSSHFDIPLIFCSLLSQPCSISYFFSFWYLFLILEIEKKKKCVHRGVNIPQGKQRVSSAQQVKSCSAEIVLGWVTKYEYLVL